MKKKSSLTAMHPTFKPMPAQMGDRLGSTRQAIALFVAPSNVPEAKHWLYLCICFLRYGFHPDTPGQDYVNFLGKRTFTKAQAKEFEKARKKVFALIEDPYAECLALTEPKA